MAKKTKGLLDDIFFGTLEKPLVVGIILFSLWIALTRLNLGVAAYNAISKSYHVLIALNITWFIARLANGILDEYTKPSKDTGKPRLNARLAPLFKRALLILIWIIGIVTALNNIGVEVTTLLGTLGIGGIAFAMAAQDTIKNFFGGITIFTDHPFRIGDIIRFDSYEGTVEDISLRSTRLRTYEKRLITIPNYKITDALVTNISREPGRRVLMKLGLTYDTGYDNMQLAISLLKEIPEIIPEIQREDMMAAFTEFGDSALTITFIYYIRKNMDIFATMSKVNFEILKRFNDANLNFAFPSQTIYVEKDF
jgi:MscS family membrane protein